jgi:hypothetical protein
MSLHFSIHRALTTRFQPVLAVVVALATGTSGNALDRTQDLRGVAGRSPLPHSMSRARKNPAREACTSSESELNRKRDAPTTCGKPYEVVMRIAQSALRFVVVITDDARLSSDVRALGRPGVGAVVCCRSARARSLLRSFQFTHVVLDERCAPHLPLPFESDPDVLSSGEPSRLQRLVRSLLLWP